MAAGDPAELLALIEERAPRLLAAGVTGRVDIPGVVSFELAAPRMPAVDDDDDDELEIDDPLADPETYGGRRPPRIRRGDDA